MKKNRIRTKAKPDVLIISATSEVSYADILKTIISNQSLAALSNNVKAIRRTAKQELLLQLRHAPDIKTKDLRTAVADILRNSAGPS